MSVIEIIGAFVLIISSVIIVVIVALQDPKGDGISALAGANSFLSGTSDRSQSAILNKVTKVLAIVFIVATVAVYAIGVRF